MEEVAFLESCISASKIETSQSTRSAIPGDIVVEALCLQMHCTFWQATWHEPCADRKNIFSQSGEGSTPPLSFMAL